MREPSQDLSARDRYVRVMKALSDPTRLEMLRLIGTLSSYPCTSLERQLPVTKSTISYHIKVLSQAGLVSVRRDGRFFHYALRRDVLDYYAPQLLSRIEGDTTAADDRTTA
jgi:DNA-binding transcriptional ArsR family regulator